MTGSPRVNHHDEVGPQASRGNLPLLLGHPAASVMWLNAGKTAPRGRDPSMAARAKKKKHRALEPWDAVAVLSLGGWVGSARRNGRCRPRRSAADAPAAAVMSRGGASAPQVRRPHGSRRAKAPRQAATTACRRRRGPTAQRPGGRGEAVAGWKQPRRRPRPKPRRAATQDRSKGTAVPDGAYTDTPPPRGGGGKRTGGRNGRAAEGADRQGRRGGGRGRCPPARHSGGAWLARAATA